MTDDRITVVIRVRDLAGRQARDLAEAIEERDRPQTADTLAP